MNKDLRKTKIIGTIGPASESEEMLTKLMQEGLNVCRINFSHGGYEENEEKIATIKRVRDNLNMPVPIALDTKGPEIRTGKLESGDEKVVINEGQDFVFMYDEIIGNNTKTHLSYKEIYKDVKIGDSILVDDGAIEFEVKEIKDKNIYCVAKNTGKLGSRKTVNVPGVKLELPALSEKDIKDLTNGVKAGFNYIFASFIRRADDVKQMRKLLNDNGGERVKIIAKIESQEGIENFEEILELVDGIMVARGDMGVEIPMEQVPIVQKHMIKRCNAVGKPVITATQMLESMQGSPRPTRAEVSDVANAVYDLTGCIMLSGECAVGKYPVECVKTMVKISEAIEGNINYWKRFEGRKIEENTGIKQQTAIISCKAAKEVNADAIVTYTNTGRMAELLSGCRPKCPIIAITDNKDTYNSLGLIQNVYPVYQQAEDTISETMNKAIARLEDEKILEKDDIVVMASGDKVLPGNKENRAISGIVRI